MRTTPAVLAVVYPDRECSLEGNSSLPKQENSESECLESLKQIVTAVANKLTMGIVFRYVKSKNRSISACSSGSTRCPVDVIDGALSTNIKLYWP